MYEKLEWLTEEEREAFYDWVNLGIERRWISKPFCSTHDGDPYMTEEEDLEWSDGGDPCCVVSKFIRGT